MKKLTVANLNIDLITIDKNFLINRVREYENNTFAKGDMILKSAAYDRIKVPEGDLLKTINTVNIVRVDNNKLCRYVIDRGTGEIVESTYYNEDYSDVEIQLLKSRVYMGLTMTDYEYIMTGIVFGDRLAELGGLVLHGSSVAFENQGIIFSANSGTGKSTHTGLWKERFGHKITIVNDDKPAIRFYEDTPYIFGTPWSGKTDLNRNVSVPLKAIVFIKRSDSNWIERLNARDSVFNLTSQISRPYYDERLCEKSLGIIEKLVTYIPIYRLHCNISQEAVEVVFNEIIEKERNKYENCTRLQTNEHC